MNGSILPKLRQQMHLHVCFLVQRYVNTTDLRINHQDMLEILSVPFLYTLCNEIKQEFPFQLLCDAILKWN